MKQHGFFDENDRLKELSKLGGPLERLNISCYARTPLSPMLKVDSNSIARFNDARYIIDFIAR
jgi:hypothetical protein